MRAAKVLSFIWRSADKGGIYMQHEITKVQRLLDENGQIAEPGWARRPLWIYDRRDVRALSARIKEWDYYLVTSDTFAAAFTISDLGYAGMASVSVIDFLGPSETTKTVLTPFPLGKLGLRAASTSGDVDFKSGNLHLRYSTKPGARHIQCTFKDFRNGEDLTAKITMCQPKMDSICIATPWKEDPKTFYYNQKVNCMPARGFVRIGREEHRFEEKLDMAVLDWGRGVWTYDNTWYWGTCSTRIDGRPFGFNLGYGFSDRSSASENAIFYRGKLHKLEDVRFEIPKNDKGAFSYTDPWTITSSDGRFEAVFMPIIDRVGLINLGVFVSDQHQVFGHMTGTAILDDGRAIKMREIPAALERVHNRY